MEKDLISIIVPIYNIAPYLPACIESIMQQTYTRLEILLIDDGSTDASAGICDEYALRDGRIKVVHKINEGLVRARKTGLEHALGKYIIFVDGDDYIEHNLCERMLEHIINLKVDFVHANYMEGNNKQVDYIRYQEIYDLDKCNRPEFVSDQILKAAFSSNDSCNMLIPSIWAKIFRTDFIKKCYTMVPDNQSFGEDLVCLCQMILYGKTFAVVPEAYYHYRIRNNSMSHKIGIDNVCKISTLYTCLKNLFEDNNCYMRIEGDLLKFYKHAILDSLRVEQPDYCYISKFFLYNMSVLSGKKIILYGAGAVGMDYYTQICRYENISILDWVDKNYRNIHCAYRIINSVERLKNNDYDIVLVAVLKKHMAEKIREELVSLGVAEEKIIWIEPHYI